MERLPREIRLEQRKNKVIEELSNQFSQNELPMEEYERLVEYINKAETEREIAIIEKISRENSLYAGGSPDEDRDEKPDRSGRKTASGDDKSSVALLSTRHLSGEYFTGRNHFLYNVLGSHVIEIDEDELPGGRTEITVISLLGEVKVRVPPNVRVKINAIPILGEAKVSRGIESINENSPELVIHGTAILSSIKVKYSRKKWF